MTNVRSWQFWVIIALALATMACAGRRERREEAREAKRERAEQRRAERQEQLERKRAERESQRASEAQAAPPPAAAPAAVLTPIAAVAVAPAAAPDAASRVVFMRVSKQSSGTNASLFDVTEPGAPKFIGNVNAAAKISYSLNPGIYTFMVVGETAEFMQATIVGGKTYYALVIPRSGAKRFAIEPVRRNEIGGKEFTTWDRGTKLMTDTGTAQGFNAAEVADKRNRYWQDWSKKAAGERAELTINAEDGR